MHHQFNILVLINVVLKVFKFTYSCEAFWIHFLQCFLVRDRWSCVRLTVRLDVVTVAAVNLINPYWVAVPIQPVFSDVYILRA